MSIQQRFIPYLPWLVIYLAGVCIWSPSSRCATYWRLEDGEVNPVNMEIEEIWANDPLFHILASSTSNIDNPANENENTSSDMLVLSNEIKTNEEVPENTRALAINIPAYEKFRAATLTCGDPVNESAIDHLEGIARRYQHPVYAEPEVVLLFQKNEFDNVQLDVIEVNLMDARKSRENKIVLYNQIANFLRIHGDTYHSIECFRKVIKMSNNNVDALLNLARILYNLQYINDAIFLAEQSLDHHSTDQTTWLQHFTLGEFFEGNGEFERALSHFQMALDQNPAFHPALLSLKKLGKTPVSPSTNFYTVCVIIVLCCGIMVYLYHNLIKDPREINNNVLQSNVPRNKKPPLQRRSKSAM